MEPEEGLKPLDHGPFKLVIIAGDPNYQNRFSKLVIIDRKNITASARRRCFA